VPAFIAVPAADELRFRPSEREEVPRSMVGLIDWLNSDHVYALLLVLRPGIAHYECVRIHPFVDGNGRTARALATPILLNSTALCGPVVRIPPGVLKRDARTCG
jgi:Fic family protein